jgi:hypothetical protein
MGYNTGSRAFTAGEALLEKRRVKIKAGTTTTPPEVEYADAGEQHIGITEADAALAEVVSVKLRTAQGSVEGVASEALAKGATLYGAADGKIADTSSGSAIGVALEAATADGDVIEWVQFAVLSTTAATVSHADAGNFTAAATAEAALQEIYQHLLSVQSQIQVPIFAFAEASGAALAVFANAADPTPGYSLDNSEALGIRWNNHANPDPIGCTVAMPQDLDDTANIVLHLLASKSGATLGDAVTFTCQAFFQTVGALHDADADAGGASSAMTGDAAAKTVAELTLTIAAADVPASPSCLTLTIQPTDGTLGTDDVTLHAVWVEYKRKILTA